MLNKWKVGNVMDSWVARDSVEDGSDSSGNDTSYSGVVGHADYPEVVVSRFLYQVFLLDSYLMSCVGVPPRRLLKFVGLRSWRPQSVSEKL